MSTGDDGIETVSVWVRDAASAAAVAAAEAASGVDIVELYRGFDLGAAAEVLAAVRGKTPVGFAMCRQGALRVDRIIKSATIFKAGPGEHELVARSHGSGSGTTILAGSGDASITVALAQRFADEGADLIEICGGETLATVAAVVDASGGRVPVSYVLYPYDALESAAAHKASFVDSD